MRKIKLLGIAVFTCSILMIIGFDELVSNSNQMAPEQFVENSKSVFIKSI
ncbi:TPA: hypothetical protein QCY08_003789 [Bacillus paranthracis]|uniref:Uncharacterized protein n=1 Tax=Bacillus cereus 03BB108 TaxID=451709 RepID=A0AAN0W4Q1_BACCE|nr:hypothetical protein [Bacillus cereus]AJI08801.1 hypothetical protein AK40_5569 [Bacillus cereus 03BB108]EDX59911.1 hypothetical protein BC03BB108_B0215 [Bacillus cereus 03BB108]QKG99058.1 hypothetical protein FOC96_02055 [Bacillus cereus]HDR7766768.1 hypothetical protein [Bacillus paranthracis]